MSWRRTLLPWPTAAADSSSTASRRSTSQTPSAAAAIRPVGPLDESTSRDIRRVAGTLIYPPVRGLEVLGLAPADDARAGVLALIIPDSEESPHLIHPAKGRGWFAAPYRSGPDTMWMIERQLASAYAQRERSRRTHEQDLDELFDRFAGSLTPAQRLRGVVAVGVPLRARYGRLSRAEAELVFSDAWASPICSTSAVFGGVGPASETAADTSARAFRGFQRASTRQAPGQSAARIATRALVGDDGHVAVAFTRDGAIPHEGQQPTQVPVSDIECTARDFFALLWSMRRRLDMTGDYAVRLTVHPPTQIFRQPDPELPGAFKPWNQQRIYGYVPVDGVVVTDEGVVPAIDAWMETVRDAVEQTGSRLGVSGDDLAASVWAER